MPASVYVCVRAWVGARARLCVCVYVCARSRMCACVFMSALLGAGVCVSVIVGTRSRKRAHVFDWLISLLGGWRF